MSPPPWLIPYVDYYTGPTRVLTLDLQEPSRVSGSYKPVVSIDGRQYVVVWGQVCFEIPVERNVHLSVHLEADRMAYTASALIPAGSAPLGFRYDKVLTPLTPSPETPR